MALSESDSQVLCTASLQAALLDKQMKLALSLNELHTAEAARAEQVMGRWQVRQLAAISLGVAFCCQLSEAPGRQQQMPVGPAPVEAVSRPHSAGASMW